MRTIRGADAARRALLEGRGLDLDSVPQSLATGIAERFGEPLTPTEVVDRIVGRVRRHGDEAVREFADLLDGGAPDPMEIPGSELEMAAERVPEDLVAALRTAACRVERFHQLSMPSDWQDRDEGYGSVVRPIGRAGIYVPGGTAAYPSTVVMTAMPARVAGVCEIIVCTPPAPGSDLPHQAVLAACCVAGVDRVFAVGGAQAVAAMAYGTESIPRVDVVCGPGNIFVALAKRRVYGDVGIDGLYGPTETVIIADHAANPVLCAADLLAQAEHDELAMPVLLTTSPHAGECRGCRMEGEGEQVGKRGHGDSRHGRKGPDWGGGNPWGGGGRLQRLCPRACLPRGLRPGRACGQAKCGGDDLCGRALPRGARGLRGRSKPRDANGRHGEIRVRPGGALVPQARPCRRDEGRKVL